MNYEISKELFKAVMSPVDVDLIKIKDDLILFQFNTYIDGAIQDRMFINEFYFVCKEWANKKHYALVMRSSEEGCQCVIYKMMYRSRGPSIPVQIQVLNDPDEKNLVFNSSQWILDRETRVWK